jgi:hypothetical protein
VDFAQIFASAQQTLQSTPQSQHTHQQQEPRRLAEMHTARAVENTQAPSTFESQQQNVALKRMSNFINSNMSTIRRLSRLPTNYNFTDIMTVYGKQPTGITAISSPISSQSYTRAPSEALSNSIQGLRIRGNTPPLPAPQALRMNGTPSLERNVQQNYQQSPLPSIPVQQQNTQHEAMLQAMADLNAANMNTNAAVVQLNRRQPPRSSTPLPASPRASLALSASLRRLVQRVICLHYRICRIMLRV